MEKRTFTRIPFKTKAIVRQKDSTVIGIGMGIEFRNLDLDAFFHLENLITYNTDKFDAVKKEFDKFTNKQDRKS